MDIRKPFLQSFTVKELMQFIDYYIEHKEMLHVPGHPWEVCDLVARFLGLGYSRQWSEDETAVLVENYPSLGAEKTSELLLMRTAYDCKVKADKLGLYTNIKPDRKKRYAAWAVSELNLLTKYYPIIGPKAMVLLPGRTEAACCGMAQKIGIAQSSTGLWSESELTILKDHYSQMGPEIRSLLPFRSTNGITNMAMKMGIPGPDRNWTADDDEIIKAQYPHMGSSVASLLDGRHTGDACIQRARFLGLSRPTEERMWSENELEILKENYSLLGRRTAKLLPGRTETACGGMAKKLGLTKKGRAPSDKTPWTEDEIRILRDNYPKSGVLGVQKLLPNRSSTACSNMAIRLGLTAKQSKEEITWSDAEIEILKEHYPDMGKDITRLLPGRTAATCRRKAYDLGLSIHGHYWSEEEDAIIREYYPREGKEVSQRLPDRSETSCVQRARKLGLYRMKSTDDHISQADAPGEAVRPEEAGDHVNEDATAYAVTPPQIVEELDETQQDQNESAASQFGMMQMQ